MKLFPKIYLILFSGILLNCASGNCRVNKDQSAISKSTAAAATVSTAIQDRVKVFKYDGSKQCGQGKATAIAEMQKELKGITVYSSENRPDKLMHIQLCGSNTGTANVYEIDRAQMETATKAGFREWTFE